MPEYDPNFFQRGGNEEFRCFLLEHERFHPSGQILSRPGEVTPNGGEK